MKVQFLNHACVLVSSGDVGILCDPWFEGKAFDGWKLLHKENQDINKIAFDYIWISHEHPDHFSIPTLKSLKTKTRFLYQETKDKKVLSWLKKEGHEVIELKPYIGNRIKDFIVYTYPFSGYDTAIVFKEKDGKVYLNANDCRLEEEKVLDQIKAEHPRIDAMSIQFSYANWAGNIDDMGTRRYMQRISIDRIARASQVLKVRNCHLFASYIYFSHQENYHLNSGKLNIKETCDLLKEEGVLAQIVKPTEYLQVNADMLEKTAQQDAVNYWDDLAKSIMPDSCENVETSEREIEAAYRGFFSRVWTNNNNNICRTEKNSDFRIAIKDRYSGEIYMMSLFEQSFSVIKPNEDLYAEKIEMCACELSKESMIFLLNKDYARGTLCINGRIVFNYKYMHLFFIFFFMPYANNVGRYWKSERLRKHELQSISDISIFKCLYKQMPELEKYLELDLDKYFD